MNETKELTEKASEKKPTARRDQEWITPSVDVVEDSTGITLYAELPGVSKENLNVQVEAGALTLAGELSLDVPQGMEANHVEVGLPGFRRVFNLSKELDADRITADFKQGLLKLRIPKTEQAQPRKIAINVE